MATIDSKYYRVMRYADGDRLDGHPSAELVERSEAAEPTGVVSAYRDGDGVWQYVPDAQVDFYIRQRREDVIAVWVEVQ